MLSNLKIGVAKKKLAKTLKKSLEGNVQGNTRFGVILDSDSENLKQHFTTLMQDIGVRETEYQIVVCKDEGQKEELFQGLVFTRKDLTWNGKIKNGEITGFANQQIAVLISYTETENKLASLLTSVSTAELKVGRMEDANSAGLFDMVISTRFEDPEIFIEELKKYLRILNLIENE